MDILFFISVPLLLLYYKCGIVNSISNYFSRQVTHVKKTRFNLLAKFLISYVLVLLLPVSIILFYYYPYAMDIVKEKQMEWNVHITDQVMNAMDIFTRYAYNLPFRAGAEPGDDALHGQRGRLSESCDCGRNAKIQCDGCFHRQHLSVCQKHRLPVLQDWKRIHDTGFRKSGSRILLRGLAETCSKN